ncbi:MAG: T9SS type A sorting domain-containing protein, partial [Fibrobacterota bacterium]
SDIPEYWPLNSVAEGQGGWWGGITKNQLGRHYDYVQERIDDHRLVVYTPTEAVAYRITANATESASVSSADGNDYLLTTTLNRPDLDQRYWEEISVIVSLDEAQEELYSAYTNISSAHEEEWGAAPRIQPRKMDDAGRVWSVSVNPFLSDGELKIGPDVVSVIDDSNKENLLKEVQFNGVINNGINLSLTEDVHTVQLFDLRGRMVKEATLTSQANNTVQAFSVTNLTKGMYLLRINSQNANTTKTHRIQL